MKVKRPPSTALYPCPIILLTCQDSQGAANIITLAWTGTICSDPPMISFSIRPNRHSFTLLQETLEVVANIPTAAIVKQTDFCGIVSGRDLDKFAQTGLTPEPADCVKPPLISECPINLECIIKQRIPLGSHYLFLAEIVQVHVNSDILTDAGRINYTQAAPIVYNQGEYWNLKEQIGTHGFSKR
jgi:flavin reductase (DIM6/NTAB) family NADH-FMN oxidoreductase RutF